MHLYIFIYFYGPVRVQSSEAAPSWFASSKRILLTASPCRGTAVLIGAEFEYGRFKKPREKNKPNIEKQWYAEHIMYVSVHMHVMFI